MAMTSKKDTILETATRLFSTYGYHSVGIDRIISEAKIAKMTLYKHFSSKEKLIEETLKKRDTDLRESILKAVEVHQDPVSKLKAIFEWYSAWFNSKGFHGCMFIKAVEEHTNNTSDIKPISQEHKLWLTNLIESILQETKIKNKQAFASHIMVILDGLTVSANMFKPTDDQQIMMAWEYIETLLTDRPS